ncbi:unnamed protein product [Schistocephalus solidus]|uniref:UBR-type domain-containing protein n=1 Tax=Schistocephalus solidus TaxID=70667 RepID=A0A3P7DSE4_SCHSO|nr:unnamed protein product [Schistocephalus solidus]
MFASTDEAEYFFTGLLNHVTQSALLLEEGYNLLEKFRGELSTGKPVFMTLGYLIHLGGTLDVFSALITRLQAGLASESQQKASSAATTAKRDKSVREKSTLAHVVHTADSDTSRQLDETLPTSQATMVTTGTQACEPTVPPVTVKISASQKKLLKARLESLIGQLLYSCLDLADHIWVLLRVSIGLPTEPFAAAHQLNLDEALTLLSPSRLSQLSDGSQFAHSASILLSSTAICRLAEALKAATGSANKQEQSTCRRLSDWTTLCDNSGYFGRNGATQGSVSASAEQVTYVGLSLMGSSEIYSFSQTLFVSLTSGFQDSLFHLSSAVTVEEDRRVETLRLLLLGRLYRRLIEVAELLASYVVSENLTSTCFTAQTDSRASEQLYRLARLHLDPVSSSLGVDLFYPSCPLTLSTAAAAAESAAANHLRLSNLAKLFVQQSFVAAQQRLQGEQDETPVSKTTVKAKRKASATPKPQYYQKLVIEALEDRILDLVTCYFARAHQTTDAQQLPSHPALIRLFSSVREEAFGYLELASGTPRFIQRCLTKVHPSLNTSLRELPFLSLFVSPTPTATGDQSIQEASSQMRLLNFILLRAINPPSHEALFSQLAAAVIQSALTVPESSTTSPTTTQQQSHQASLLQTLFIAFLSTPKRGDDGVSRLGCYLIDEERTCCFLEAISSTEMEGIQQQVRQALKTLVRVFPLSSYGLVSRAHSMRPERLRNWLRYCQRRRFCLFVERFLRLLAAPWTSDSELHSKTCLQVFDLAVGLWKTPVLLQLQCLSTCAGDDLLDKELPDLQALPLSISGLRCLALVGSPSVMPHLRLFEVLCPWAEGIITILLGKNQSILNDRLQNDLVLTLRSIYDYMCLLFEALDPKHKSLSQGDSPSPALPDIHYWNLEHEATAEHLQSHPSVSPTLLDYFAFVFNLKKNGSIKLGESWNVALDVFLREALCGPVACSAGSPRSDLLASFYATEYGLEEICTFASTQHNFAQQPWYCCHTCDMVNTRGVCHLCAQLCHAGHDLTFSTTSEFFCDCADEMGPLGRCCSMRRQLCRPQLQKKNKNHSLFSAFLPWTNRHFPKLACNDTIAALKNATDLSSSSIAQATETEDPGIIGSELSGNNSVRVTGAATTPSASLPPLLRSTGSHPLASRIRRMGAIRRKPLGSTAAAKDSRDEDTPVDAGAAAALKEMPHHQVTPMAGRPKPLPLGLSTFCSVASGTFAGFSGTRFGISAADRRRERLQRFITNFLPCSDSRNGDSTSLQPLTQFAIQRLRSQFESSEGINTRKLLLTKLANSSLLAHTVRVFALATESVSTVTALEESLLSASAEADRLRELAVDRLLSIKRSFSPPVHLSFQLTTPVLLLDAPDDEIWASLSYVKQLFSTKAITGPVAPPTEISPSLTDSPAPPLPEIPSPVDSPSYPFKIRQTSAASRLLNSHLPPTATSTDSAAPATPANSPAAQLFLSNCNEALVLDQLISPSGRGRGCLIGRGAISQLLASNPSLEALQLISSSLSSLLHSGAPGTDDALAGNQRAAMTLLRVPASSNGEWHHFLLVGGVQQHHHLHGLLGSTSSHPANTSAATAASEGPFTQNGKIAIYAVDDLLNAASARQDDTDFQLLLGHSFMGLLSATSPCEQVSAKSATSTAIDTASTTHPMLQPVVVPLSSLQRIGMVNVGFNFNALVVHPENEALFAASDSRDCTVFGLSSIGQVCGCVSVAPRLEAKDDILIRPIWLPNSCRFLALLTTQSVQIFDLFSQSPKLLYHFKPVEGKFSDATFIRRPRIQDQPEALTEADSLLDVILVVISTFGSIITQSLIPETKISHGQYYLYDWLEWNPETVSAGTAANLQRDPRTGTLGGGGVCVYYAASLCLLLHSSESLLKLVEMSGQEPLTSALMHLAEAASATSIAQPPTTDSPVTSSATDAAIKSDSATTSSHLLPWSGPLTNWSEVRGHPGLLTATTVEPTHGRPLQRHVLIAFEPDRVWMQPMPVTGQQVLPLVDKSVLDQAKDTSAAAVAEGNRPAIDSSAEDSKESKDTASSKSRTPSFVIDSTTRFWAGTSELMARSFTLQLTSDGNLQLFSTSPHSLAKPTPRPAESSGSEADFIREHHLPATLPGHFWLQPALCSTSPALSTSPLPLPWPAAIDSLLPLESGLLWDLGDQVALKKSHTRANLESPWAFFRRAVSARPLLRRILESTGVSKPVFDFLEWSSATDNVTFGGKDLLGIYNQDLLRHRLITAGSPVTRAGHSVSHKSLPARIAKSTEFAPEDVAFVLDIHNTRPANEIIVGLVIELAADANTRELSWPRFLSVFGRRIDVHSTGKQSKSRTLELPLCLEEMFIPQTPLHLCVGRSKHPDGLTSIDTVQVYSVPRAHLDPSVLPSGLVARSEENSSAESGDCALSAKRACLYNAALVNWMDRILTTGFITDALRNHSGAPSRPDCAFVSPTYETSDLAVLLSSCSPSFSQKSVLQPDYSALLSSLCAFLSSTLSLDIGAKDYAENSSNACVLSTTSRDLEPLAIDCLKKVSLSTFSTSPLLSRSSASYGLASRLLRLCSTLAASSNTALVSLELTFNPNALLISFASDAKQATAPDLRRISSCLKRLAGLLQHKHEFSLTGGCPSASCAPTAAFNSSMCDILQGAVPVLESMLSSGDYCVSAAGLGVSRPGLSLIAPRLHSNLDIFTVLQPLVRAAFYLLADALTCRHQSGNKREGLGSQQPAEDSVSQLTGLLFRLLMHKNIQVAVHTRDLLCGCLTCLFPGNHHLSIALFEPDSTDAEAPTSSEKQSAMSVNATAPDESACQQPGTPSNETEKTKNASVSSSSARALSRLRGHQSTTASGPVASVSRRIRRLQDAESDLEALGVEVAELLQLLNDDMRSRLRLAGAHAELLGLQAAAAELQLRTRQHRTQHQTADSVTDNTDPIWFMDEFSEVDEDEDSNVEVSRTRPGGGAAGASESWELGAGASREEGAAAENPSDVCRRSPPDWVPPASSRPTQMLVSTELQSEPSAGPTDQYTPATANNSPASQLPPENDALSIPGAMELVSQALGLGSLGADEYLSEDAMLNLALQLSLQDQGGPGTAALIAEEQEARASGLNAPLPVSSTSPPSPSNTAVPSNDHAASHGNPLATADTPALSDETQQEEPRSSAVSGSLTAARPEGTNVSNASEPSHSSPSSLAERRPSTDAAPLPPPPPPRLSQPASLAPHVSVGTSVSSLQADVDPGTEADDRDDVASATDVSTWSFSSHLISSTSFSSSSHGDSASSAVDDDDENASADGKHPSQEPPPPDPLPSGEVDNMSRDLASLSAARVCVCLLQQAGVIWEELIGRYCSETASSGDGRRLVPLLQTIFTLARLVETVPTTAQFLETGLSREASSEKKALVAAWAELAPKARSALKNLLTVLATSLLSGRGGNKDASKPSAVDLQRSPRTEALLLTASLLALLLKPSTLSLSTLSASDAKALAAAPDVAAVGVENSASSLSLEALGSLESDSLRSQCMDLCLEVVQSCCSRWRADAFAGEVDGVLQQNFSASPTNASTLPLLTSGLLQSALGVNFASLGLGFAAGLTNWSPLLDGQLSVDNLPDPLHDFISMLTESALSLTIALYASALPSGASANRVIASQTPPPAALETATHSSDEHTHGGGGSSSQSMSSKWCPVAYNFLEVIAPYGQVPDTAGFPYVSKSSSVRLAELLRSLLILLVGPKTYRHLRDIHHLAQMVERVRSICGSDVQTQSADVNLSSTTSDSLSDPSLFSLARSEESQLAETLMLRDKLQLSFESECSIVRFFRLVLFCFFCNWLLVSTTSTQPCNNNQCIWFACRIFLLSNPGVLSPDLSPQSFTMQAIQTVTSYVSRITC